MLKYVINTKKNVSSEIKIDIENIRYNDDKIYFKTKNLHNFNDNNEIILKRISENGNVFFKDKFFVYIVDNKNFYIEKLSDETIKIFKCEDITIFSPLKNKETNLLKFTTLFNVNLLTNRNIEPKVYINGEVLKNKKICNGDYVIYDNIYLLKKTDDAGDIVYENKKYNTTEKFYFYDNKQKYNEIELFLGVDNNGNDIRNILYWEYDKNNEKSFEIVEYLKNNFHSIIFSHKNAKYFSFNDKNIEFKKDFNDKTDAFIFYEKNEIDLFLNSNEFFDPSLLKNEYYNNFYVDEKKKKCINKPIDMEKQIFVPRLNVEYNYSKNNTIVNEINFKIKLRERKNEKDWRENIISSGAYNNTNPSLLTEIGFTEDDIKYQKNSLKKSFLRLSFFDKPNRGSQSLLYYSTIFFNTNIFFSDYVTNNKINECEFSIKNIFDYFNCSEGYYLYLFPSLCKNDIPTTIYMKAEFNHAKYGKIIPLVLPTNENYKTGYIHENYEDGINNLFNDMYIKVNIMYDTKINKYVWFFENKNVSFYNDKKIEMILFEPIVNKINEN